MTGRMVDVGFDMWVRFSSESWKRHRVRSSFLLLSSCGPYETGPISGVKRELLLCCVMQCNFSTLCWVKVPVLLIDLLSGAAYLASVWALRVKGKCSTLVSWVQHGDHSPFRQATMVCFPAISRASSSQSPLAGSVSLILSVNIQVSQGRTK